MSKTPPNTVVTSGASPGNILVGFHKSGNQGLLIQVLDFQPTRTTGRIRGRFVVLHEGVGKYASGIRRVIDKIRYFDDADEFIRLVSMQDGCRDCTHGLNLNALWKLDVGMIYDRIINVEEQAEPKTDVRRCPDCGQIYDDLSLNFCLADGSRLFTEGGDVETVIRPLSAKQPSDRETSSWKNKGTQNQESGYEYIRNTAISHPNLDILVHPGNNHRIAKHGTRSSMWISPRGRGVSISATGEASHRLYREMERRLGHHHREDKKGYRFWQADNPQVVVELIAFWGDI